MNSLYPNGTIQTSSGSQSPQFSSTIPPSSFFRSASLGPVQMTRQVSMGSRSLISPPADWRSTVSIEDRLQQRARIKSAYEQSCPTYESLLDAIEAMDEELLFAFATSRVDYGKAGIDYESRVRVKKQQLAELDALLSVSKGPSSIDQSDNQSNGTDSNGSLKHNEEVETEENSDKTEEESDKPPAKRRK